MQVQKLLLNELVIIEIYSFGNKGISSAVSSATWYIHPDRKEVIENSCIVGNHHY